MNRTKPQLAEQQQRAAEDPQIDVMLTSLFNGPRGEDALDEFEEMCDEAREETPEQMRERAQRLLREFPPYAVWSRSLTAQHIAFIKRGFLGPRDFYCWYMGKLAEFAGQVQ